MSKKPRDKKLGLRAPRKLRSQFRVWYAQETDFIATIPASGFKEDVLAAMLLDWLERKPDALRDMLKKRLPEIAAMYTADPEGPSGSGIYPLPDKRAGNATLGGNNPERETDGDHNVIPRKINKSKGRPSGK